MTTRNVATTQEVLLAEAFLRTLGADWHSVSLIQGVVAWFRSESGSLSNVIGNNPFNLRPGADDAQYRNGVRQGRVGSFSTYANLTLGFEAAANRLLSAGNDYRGYGLIVRAARSGSVSDFLTAIAMSRWDASHYGYPATNHLIVVYNAITGLTMPAGGTTAGPDGKPKPPPRHRTIPPVPPALQPPPTMNPFMDGFEASRFYRARPHKVDPV